VRSGAASRRPGSLADPPRLVARYWPRPSRLPDYVDDFAARRRATAQYTMPNAVHAISLSRALWCGVESPSIAPCGHHRAAGGRGPGAVGRPASGCAPRPCPRDAAGPRPGTWRPSVRMLHAHMRRLARGRGYD